METLIINIPDKKSTVVKLLLKELGVTIQSTSKTRFLAEEINNSVSVGGDKPTMEDITVEVKAVRAQR